MRMRDGKNEMSIFTPHSHVPNTPNSMNQKAWKRVQNLWVYKSRSMKRGKNVEMLLMYEFAWWRCTYLFIYLWTPINIWYILQPSQALKQSWVFFISGDQVEDAPPSKCYDNSTSIHLNGPPHDHLARNGLGWWRSRL